MLVRSRARSALHAGLGSTFHAEALPEALPRLQNNPKVAPYGLHTELLSGNAFTAPRAQNPYSWMYRIRPSVLHTPRRFEPLRHRSWVTPPFEVQTPAPLRLAPIEVCEGDWVDSVTTLAGNSGATAGVYAFSRDMSRRVFCHQDAELMLVPQQGALRLRTEFGPLSVEVGEMCLLPRGMRFAVDAMEAGVPHRGYVLENFGANFRVPELGPIGVSSGLAQPRHFLAPEPAFEDLEAQHEVVCKFGGKLFHGEIPFCPFDVVAWYGSLVPLKYDMSLFMSINTVSFDHPDPSINTVVTSPTAEPGVANVDFVIFAPRWMAAENTFRPPWFHRNYMSEYMGLVRGVYDAKPGASFSPGCSTIHNRFTPHGPDAGATKAGQTGQDTPERYADTLAFMWESNQLWVPTAAATQLADATYSECWDNIPKTFDPKDPRTPPHPWRR